MAGPPAFPARLEPGCSGRTLRLSRVRLSMVWRNIMNRPFRSERIGLKVTRLWLLDWCASSD